MTTATICDGCNDRIETTAMDIRLDYDVRQVSGTLRYNDGNKIEWYSRDLDVDLCPECAQEPMEMIRKMVNND